MSWGTHFARSTPCCLGFVSFANYSRVFAHCSARISPCFFLTLSHLNMCVSERLHAYCLMPKSHVKWVIHPNSFCLSQSRNFASCQNSTRTLFWLQGRGSAQGVLSWPTGWLAIHGSTETTFAVSVIWWDSRGHLTDHLDSSEISPTICNKCVFILRNGFTLHVSGDNLTHHQEYICCIWPQVSRLT